MRRVPDIRSWFRKPPRRGVKQSFVTGRCHGIGSAGSYTRPSSISAPAQSPKDASPAPGRGAALGARPE